jgi:ppGpp synthetase/RelA/SpoT-type nucleotidyltranferase
MSAPLDSAGQWLRDRLPKHERLAAVITPLLENMLRKKEIEYLSVSYRVKTFDSAIEKIGRKGYDNPQEQLTDLSGIRVITYLEEQVRQISDLIKELFDVDDRNSLDRSAVLGDDRVGYRSTHFVCCLGKKRHGLPEYDALEDLSFEVQVRTVLQHAWAELAHDRSFKFGSALPVKLQRKLNLYSGMLEIVDTAFDDISKAIDSYRISLENKSIEQISDVPIDSLSVERFVRQLPLNITIDAELSPKAIDELRHFGVAIIDDLRRLATPEFLEEFSKAAWGDRTVTGAVRDLMMYNDLDKYLDGPRTWNVVGPETVDFMASKYGKKRVLDAFERKGIRVASSEESVQMKQRIRRRDPQSTSKK